MPIPFRDYWSGLKPEEKQALARDAATNKDYLSQVANGHRQAGAKLIKKLTRVRSDIEVGMFFETPESDSTARMAVQ